MTTTWPPTLLRTVFGVHGAITSAGAVVLTVWPNAIPSMVGITLAPDDFLIVYLTGAAELAAAVLSFGAMRLSDVAALRLVVVTLVVMHGASGVLNLAYMAQTGWSGVLIANTCARAAAVAVLLGAWSWSVRRAHHT